MSDNLRYYLACMFELDHVIRQVPDDRWDTDSPCEGWSAREVAGHAIGVVAVIPGRLGLGPEINPFEHVAEIAGDDPAASFRPIKQRTMRALDTEGALATTVRSSAGEMTLDEFLVPLGRDALVHAWDVAAATRLDVELDPDLVEQTLARLDPDRLTRDQRGYGDAVEFADDADPLTRLLALTGRRRE